METEGQVHLLAMQNEQFQPGMSMKPGIFYREISVKMPPY